jgi:hypothetical protein
MYSKYIKRILFSISSKLCLVKRGATHQPHKMSHCRVIPHSVAGWLAGWLTRSSAPFEAMSKVPYSANVNDTSTVGVCLYLATNYTICGVIYLTSMVKKRLQDYYDSRKLGKVRHYAILSVSFSPC